ncbi:TIGR03560 family F420-dependent LLM class oxidoreductase [Nonomuraea polychroma]|nr:TIGR03560 family F420-dependent LLM class oxidoreductase [Nonomuraea polychroma]
MEDSLDVPSPCLIVLVGPGASGKSTWAAKSFPAEWIVSSDHLRAMVGSGEDDIAASADALTLLLQIVTIRVRRRLTTVIDTLGLDVERRRAWLALARENQMACVAVAFDTPAAECRSRNQGRAKRIPVDVLNSQLRTWRRTKETLATEGFDKVISPRPVRVVPKAFSEAAAAARRQHDEPAGMRFGLHLASFSFSRDRAATAGHLRDIAEAAESAGFDGIYVMDHFRQIPQIGRPWDDFLESWTTLAYLCAHTSRVRLGTLVSGITYRNVAHLGKIVATLDILSRGRAVCGVGLAWFKEEHLAYGWEFPPVSARYALLEDALQLLPLIWGPGSPRFDGRVLSVPEAVCYPRPIQAKIPIIVGGGAERRTLRLAARYADAANVFGDVRTVRHKAGVLRRHCAEAGRDPEQVALTHLSTALVGADDRHVTQLVSRLRPPRRDPARFAESVNAGTVHDHVGRFRELAEAGVGEVIVRLPDLSDTEPIERMAKIIAAFR